MEKKRNIVIKRIKIILSIMAIGLGGYLLST